MTQNLLPPLWWRFGKDEREHDVEVSPPLVLLHHKVSDWNERDAIIVGDEGQAQGRSVVVICHNPVNEAVQTDTGRKAAWPWKGRSGGHLQHQEQPLDLAPIDTLSH